MYAQDAISSRGGRRTEPTEVMLSGLVCVVCATGYRSTPTADPTGLDKTPLPLSGRMRRRHDDLS